jgi:hypothetical protein
MPTLYPSITRRIAFGFGFALCLTAGIAQAQVPQAPPSETPHRQLAPGFTNRPAASRLVIVPADMELFSISAGGVTEPRADWTEAAQKHFKTALLARPELGRSVAELTVAQVDEFADIVALHRAVADSVFIHHSQNHLKLPTKAGRLDWSLGDVVRPLKARTGADYALFTWVRDSYASGERKAAIVAMALLGAFTTGGEQMAYASLVDLETGRIVWFNDLQRMSGDLRDPAAAAETVEALLKGFPRPQ